MRTKNKIPTLYNLEQWISEDGISRKIATLMWQVPYGMAVGVKKRAETQRHLPGTYFVIATN